MGAAWWRGDHWPTADRCAPFADVLQAWHTIHAAQAGERLSLVKAITMTKMTGLERSALLDREVQDAFHE